jgi:chromosome partitioning protein
MFKNQKGGVGKTAAAATIGHGMAMCGKRVLLVDMDSQGNVADSLGLAKGPGLYRLLVEGAGRRAIESSGRPGLDVILSDEQTIDVQVALVSQSFRGQGDPKFGLRDALRKLSGGYDMCILDMAPSVGLLESSALAAADYLLIPAQMRQLSMVGVQMLVSSVAEEKEAGNLSCELLGVLPTFLDLREWETFTQHEWLEETFGELVWPAIPVDAKAARAPAFGQTLWEYAPRSRALMGFKMRGKMVGGYGRVLARLLREVGLDG